MSTVSGSGNPPITVRAAARPTQTASKLKPCIFLPFAARSRRRKRRMPVDGDASEEPHAPLCTLSTGIAPPVPLDQRSPLITPGETSPASPSLKDPENPVLFLRGLRAQGATSPHDASITYVILFTAVIRAVNTFYTC